jgi:hypothetical protein
VLNAFWEIHIILPLTLGLLVIICVFVSCRFDSYKV